MMITSTIIDTLVPMLSSTHPKMAASLSSVMNMVFNPVVSLSAPDPEVSSKMLSSILDRTESKVELKPRINVGTGRQRK